MNIQTKDNNCSACSQEWDIPFEEHEIVFSQQLKTQTKQGVKWMDTIVARIRIFLTCVRYIRCQNNLPKLVKVTIIIKNHRLLKHCLVLAWLRQEDIGTLSCRNDRNLLNCTSIFVYCSYYTLTLSLQRLGAFLIKITTYKMTLILLQIC